MLLQEDNQMKTHIRTSLSVWQKLSRWAFACVGGLFSPLKLSYKVVWLWHKDHSNNFIGNKNKNHNLISIFVFNKKKALILEFSNTFPTVSKFKVHFLSFILHFSLLVMGKPLKMGSSMKVQTSVQKRCMYTPLTWSS